MGKFKSFCFRMLQRRIRKYFPNFSGAIFRLFFQKMLKPILVIPMLTYFQKGYSSGFHRKWILLSRKCEPCNSVQFFAIPQNSSEFFAIPRNVTQCRAIKIYSTQFRATKFRLETIVLKIDLFCV